MSPLEPLSLGGWRSLYSHSRMHKPSLGLPSHRCMQPCLHTSRDSELTTSQDGFLLFWGALSILTEAGISSLCQGHFPLFLLSLLLLLQPVSSRLAFLLTFSPYLLPFYSSCASLPVLPSPPLLSLSTAKPWGLSHSPFPELFLCDSHEDRWAHQSVFTVMKLTILWGYCHMVPQSRQCHMVCEVVGEK